MVEAAPNVAALALAALGRRYDDGLDGPPTQDRVVSQCYPYTAIVGAPELRLPEHNLLLAAD